MRVNMTTLIITKTKPRPRPLRPLLHGTTTTTSTSRTRTVSASRSRSRSRSPNPSTAATTARAATAACAQMSSSRCSFRFYHYFQPLDFLHENLPTRHFHTFLSRRFTSTRRTACRRDHVLPFIFHWECRCQRLAAGTLLSSRPTRPLSFLSRRPRLLEPVYSHVDVGCRCHVTGSLLSRAAWDGVICPVCMRWLKARQGHAAAAGAWS